MAEENEQQEQTDEEVGEKPAGGKKKKILLAAIGGVVLLGGAAAIFFLGFSGDAQEKAGDSTEFVEEKKPPGIVALDPFIVNLADESGDRFLKLTMRVEVTSEEDANHLNTHRLSNIRIRDCVLTILSARESTQIRDMRGRDQLREQIRTRLNEVLEQDIVTEIYFTEFLLQ